MAEKKASISASQRGTYNNGIQKKRKATLCLLTKSIFILPSGGKESTNCTRKSLIRKTRDGGAIKRS
jgi:hypothetical protein